MAAGPLRIHVRADAPELRAGLAAVRAEHRVADAFPPEAEAEAARAAPAGPREDRRDVALLTIDPAGSRDLDQALHLERREDGFRLRYAIADVAAWVAPGGAIDAEARRRVVTRYLPDGRAPLHPPALSEGAASLLPGQDVPAVLWTIDLDAAGAVGAVDVRRALVRSRRQLTYAEAQAGVGSDPVLGLLREVGEARIALERERGGIDLPVPEQEVVADGRGGLRLALRAQLPAERWNAQLSLLTGMCAAALMARRGTGLVRTLPSPEPTAVQRLERVARALGVAWHAGPGETLRRVDVAEPRGAAFAEAARALLRGSGYAVVQAGEEVEAHAAVAAAYAHVTAPLRRLGDRFAAECCLGEPPDWARDALPELPALMAAGLRAAAAAERAALDLVEALVLRDRVGEAFAAVALSDEEVLLTDPVVRARCSGGPPPGERVSVRLVEADPARRRVSFAWPA